MFLIPLAYFEFVLCPFGTMEYIYIGLFLIVRSISVKAVITLLAALKDNRGQLGLQLKILKQPLKHLKITIK